MKKDTDKTSPEYLAREMAKLYKALGPAIVATLREGTRVDHLTGQLELDPVYMTKDGLRWLRDAESLVAPSKRNGVSLDDLALAFEATHDPVEKVWCERGSVSPIWAMPTDKSGTFRNKFT